MKKNKKQKKLSLNKLQMAKINTGLNKIKGGSDVDGNGGTNTVVDKTNNGTIIQTGTN